MATHALESLYEIEQRMHLPFSPYSLSLSPTPPLPLSPSPPLPLSPSSLPLSLSPSLPLSLSPSLPLSLSPSLPLSLSLSLSTIVKRHVCLHISNGGLAVFHLSHLCQTVGEHFRHLLLGHMEDAQVGEPARFGGREMRRMLDLGRFESSNQIAIQSVSLLFSIYTCMYMYIHVCLQTLHMYMYM